MRLKYPFSEELKKFDIILPKYDIEKVHLETIKAPKWIHFGSGNIFRGYISRLQEDLLNLGLEDKGIIAVETFDDEIIDKIYKPYNNLVMLASMSINKPVKYQIISSIALALSTNNEKDFEQLEKYFQNPSLEMITLTITEKGYNLYEKPNKYYPQIINDINNKPKNAKNVISIITYLLYLRYKNGLLPLSLVSMDNCSHNSQKLKTAILDIAKNWVCSNYMEYEFINYLNSSNLKFPISMIDKITPRPNISIAEQLTQMGIADMNPIITFKKTYIAPYVNTEECEYLVIEDDFHKRPVLEAAGVFLTDYNTVNDVETMKVTTCLNPLHTALAVYGVLLGYNTISDEMSNPTLVNLIKGIALEGLKVVKNPGIINPLDFVKEVIEKRLPNKAIIDSPYRISTDTSLKIPIRYMETIKSYLNNPSLALEELVFIPLAIAGWLRYLLGIDDKLKAFIPSSDPMLEELRGNLKNVVVDKNYKYNSELEKILSNTNIFKLDLNNYSIGKKIEQYFIEMLDGEGAILKTLEKHVRKNEEI